MRKVKLEFSGTRILGGGHKDRGSPLLPQGYLTKEGGVYGLCLQAVFSSGIRYKWRHVSSRAEIENH